MRLLGPFLLTAALAGATARAAGPGPVDVTVVETAGVARREAPTSVAIPFARGALALRGEQQVGLDGAGAQVLERWPDGSVRWLLADFATSLPARGPTVRRLVPHTGARAEHRVRVSRDADGVRAESPGRLAVTVAEHGPVLARISAGGASAELVWPALRLVGDEAARALETERVEVEREGGRHSELLVRARGDHGLRHEVRLA
ncbi:MAG TPA: hypothetical protein VNO26_10635, partial [Candidatus Limnocylindria bacterium]|nr:hypothetical protein [Candidatus Limnocylindria bacterium]